MSYREFFILVNLARSRQNSKQDYQRFENYQGDLLVEYLCSHKVQIKNQLVLDIGCGYGGYTISLFEAGAKAIGLDLSIEPGLIKKGYLVSADALLTPFSPSSFDLIICASLIEHVPDPDLLIKEILRILKPGGTCYLSFPPFYTPIGGHQFSPYHLLGQRIAIKIVPKRKLNLGHATTDVETYQNAYGDYGLYPLTIRKIKKLLSKFQIRVIDQSTRWLPTNFSIIPLFGEFLTWHVQFLFVKENNE